MNRHAVAVHMKANALTPRCDAWPFLWNALRACTNTALFPVSKAGYLFGKSGSTYVIIEVTMIWKKSEPADRRADRYPPICQHMAMKPVKKDMTPKNRAIISKGNRNRDMRK